MKSGWVGGGITDEKGGSRKRGGQDPLTPPPLDTPMVLNVVKTSSVAYCHCQA